MLLFWLSCLFCFALDVGIIKHKRTVAQIRMVDRESGALLEIDGSQRSGSGTLLRMSVALAAIVNQPLHIFRIREKRTQPGLRPQHLEAVMTASKLCDAEVVGAKPGSRELWFTPHKIKGGEYHAEIGTAGSIPMLLLAVLPMCAYADGPVHLRVSRGGTDVKNAPTINYLKYVLLPLLTRMGLKASVTIQKYGYFPKGMGEVTFDVEPCPRLQSVKLEKFGNIQRIKGVSVCTFLADRRVAERQAMVANERLKSASLLADIAVVNDTSNPIQKGSSLLLWAETDTGVFVGGDSIGEIGKPSEVVGREAAEGLLRELKAKPTVDAHLCDMLVPYMALAEGNSSYSCRLVTEHLDANVWLAQEILGRNFHLSKVDNLYRVETE